MEARLNPIGPPHLICLWAFVALNDVILDEFTLLQRLIAIALDGTVVTENIGALGSAKEAESLRVVEPLHFAFELSHVSSSPNRQHLACGSDRNVSALPPTYNGVISNVTVILPTLPRG